MRKFERLNSEQEVLNHLEDLVNQGVNENDVKVVSKYRIEEVSARFPDVDFKDSEGGIMDKIAALFSDEEPEDKMLNSLELTHEEREECRQAIDQGQFIVFNAHNDFDGALEGDRFDMSKEDRQDGLGPTQKTEATMAGAQFGAHDAGREPGFNDDSIEDDVRNDAVNNNQPDEDSLDPMGDEKNSAPRENAFNDRESHDINDDYLKERKDDEEFSTERENEGMNTDNDRNKNYAFGKDNPMDQTSELDQDDDNMNKNNDGLFGNDDNKNNNSLFGNDDNKNDGLFGNDDNKNDNSLFGNDDNKNNNNMNSLHNDKNNNDNSLFGNDNDNGNFNKEEPFSEEERRGINNERISERDDENKSVSRENHNEAIDGVNTSSGDGGSEHSNAAIDGIERRKVDADRRGPDYDPLLDDNHAADETRVEGDRVEELSRRPYDDDSERRKEEQNVDEEVRRTRDMDYDDDDPDENRSSDLGDSLRADDAREDAFDHDKGRF